MNESSNYQKMLNEVESIVKEISSQGVDLDEMVTKVERGYELIKKMRDRLGETKEKINQLHERYEGEKVSSN